MAKLIRMPEVAANAEQAVLLEWAVKAGDAVSTGDCIAEIETDKAVVELAAENDGVMGPLLVQAGAQVAVGAPVGVLLSINESLADIDMDALLVQDDADTVITPTQAPATAVPPAVDTPASAASAAVPEPGDRIFASPLARRLAKEKGIDLARVEGSGPNGRIVKYDIDHADNAQAPMQADPVAANTYVEIPHTGMRKTIARRLTESKTTIPHFYLNMPCRVDALLALRAQINDIASRKVSINDFVIKAVACALSEVPEMNVTWADAAVRRYRDAQIAVAVSTDSGLVTPIVHAPEKKSLLSISADVASLVERARASQLAPDEYQGGTFGISNLGMYGVSDFTAIINPPQAAILAVGSARKMPVVEGDAVRVASVMSCNLSVDHRVIDGVLAAKWLEAFRRYMENPIAMLI